MLIHKIKSESNDIEDYVYNYNLRSICNIAPYFIRCQNIPIIELESKNNVKYKDVKFIPFDDKNKPEYYELLYFDDLYPLYEDVNIVYYCIKLLEHGNYYECLVYDYNNIDLLDVEKINLKIKNNEPLHTIFIKKEDTVRITLVDSIKIYLQTNNLIGDMATGKTFFSTMKAERPIENKEMIKLNENEYILVPSQNHKGNNFTYWNVLPYNNNKNFNKYDIPINVINDFFKIFKKVIFKKDDLFIKNNFDRIKKSPYFKSIGTENIQKLIQIIKKTSNIYLIIYIYSTSKFRSGLKKTVNDSLNKIRDYYINKKLQNYGFFNIDLMVKYDKGKKIPNFKFIASKDRSGIYKGFPKYTVNEQLFQKVEESIIKKHYIKRLEAYKFNEVQKIKRKKNRRTY